MIALITGASGFIGSHLTAYLASKGVRVVKLSRGNPDLTDVVTVASILDNEGVTHAFHLAGVHGGASLSAVLKDNVQNTAAFLESVGKAKRPVRTLILASSAIYGDAPKKKGAITESFPFEPITSYGFSKAAIDIMARQFFLESGRPVIRVRPFNVIGPGQKPEFFGPSMARKIEMIEKSSRPGVLELKNPRSFRDFVDVRDVARGLYLLALKGKGGEAYNLCSGSAVSVKQATEIMARLSGKKIKIREIAADPGRREVIYQRGSYAKARKEVGWKPEIPLTETLNDILVHGRMHKDDLQ